MKAGWTVERTVEQRVDMKAVKSVGLRVQQTVEQLVELMGALTAGQ